MQKKTVWDSVLKKKHDEDLRIELSKKEHTKRLQM